MPTWLWYATTSQMTLRPDGKRIPRFLRDRNQTGYDWFRLAAHPYPVDFTRGSHQTPGAIMMAVVLVSAFFMAIACIMIDRIASLCGLSRIWRILIVALFALNPVILVFGANGMSESILIAATLTGLYWLIRFWKTDRNMDLLMAAGFFSMLPLIRYEAALLTIFAGLIIFLHSWVVGRLKYNIEDFRNFVEGRLLGYSGLAIYPLFIWAVCSWFIMGNPLYFLFNDRSAISLAEVPNTSFADAFAPQTGNLLATYGIWIALFPLGLLGCLAALVLGIKNKSPLLIGLAIISLHHPHLAVRATDTQCYSALA